MKSIKGCRKLYEINQNDCFFAMVSRLEESGKTVLRDDDIRNDRGVYIFWSWDNKPVRIGKAVKLRNRILSYDRQPSNYYIYKNMCKDIQFVSVLYTRSEKESLLIELDLIKKHNPLYNAHNTKKVNN